MIRNMRPQRIVKQYMQYCYETNFKPFSPSTMLRILSCCSAKGLGNPRKDSITLRQRERKDLMICTEFWTV